ncbi:MAG: AraC family transcriptional regulator [Spirochaetia bacterium]|nr:AraC family transcriptional regulator [Spirochaetia bacterium]
MHMGVQQGSVFRKMEIDIPPEIRASFKLIQPKKRLPVCILLFRNKQRTAGCECVPVLADVPFNPTRKPGVPIGKDPFLQAHLADSLSLSDICSHCSLSKSLAQQLFKHETGTSVMQWYARLRIEHAKQLIREGKGNMTTIAYQLGYSSIHAFSKQFSSLKGKNPIEYAQSITSSVNKDLELL